MDINEVLKRGFFSRQRYKPEDIYACEMTSMFLSLDPSRLQPDTATKVTSRTTNSSSASIVFCFNANGTDKRDPLVLVRQSAPDDLKTTKDYHERVHDTKGEDLTQPTLLDWLFDFDRSLNREILLVVDEPISRLLTRGRKSFQAGLKMIRIFKLSVTAGKDLPMSVGLAKVFKAIYYRNLLGTFGLKPNTSESEIKLDTMEEYVAIISHSWNQIIRSCIERHFQSFMLRRRFSESSNRLSVAEGAMVSLDKIWEDALGPLRIELKKAFPKAPDSVLQYFDSLEKDTGPSGFLRQKIRSIRHHPDFTHCFANFNFGTVRIAKIQSQSHSKSTTTRPPS
ncbi:Tigger transposable element-derived protein 6, partial [Modicella reniformis]